MANATHDPDVIGNQVLRDNPPIGRAGFGIAMIIGLCSMTERTRTYQTPDGAQADATAGDITQALADYVIAAYGQTLKPKKVMVGRRQPNVAQVVTFLITGATDGNYTVTVNGTAFTFAAVGSTVGAIAIALQALVDAEPNTTATVAVDTVTVTADVAGTPFTFSSAGEDSITEATTVVSVSVATELDALKTASDAWYGFALESRTDLDNTQALAWSESNKKFAALETNSTASKAGTAGHIGLVLKAAGYKRGFIMWRESATSKAAWKLATNRLSVDPDRKTTIWSFVTLVGEVVDDMTDTEKLNLQNANMNYYLTLKKQACTRPGISPGGEKLDVLLTSDWLPERIDERLVTVLLSTVNRGEKIPYDDTGFKLLEGEVRDVLQTAEAAGHFQTGTSNVRFGLYSELTDGEKAARLVPYVYGGLLQGGVEAFEGTGYATTDESFLEALFNA